MRRLILGLRDSVGMILDRIVVILIALTLSLEALLAMAPLTGSDAMHYHFTAPLLEQGKPLAPIFWLMQSFYVGQAHLLISLGTCTRKRSNFARPGLSWRLAWSCRIVCYFASIDAVALGLDYRISFHLRTHRVLANKHVRLA